MSEGVEHGLEAAVDADAEGFEGRPPEALRAARLVGWVVILVIAAGSAVPAFLLLSRGFNLGAVLAAVVQLAAVMALGLGVHLYAGASHRRLRWRLDEVGLRIRRGVWWRAETLVPLSRLQHVDLNRGPIERRYGLASLKVYTAGTRLASVDLTGLADARAVELRDALISDDDDAV